MIYSKICDSKVEVGAWSGTQIFMFLSYTVRRSTDTAFTFSSKRNIWAILTQQVLRTAHILFSHCRTQFWEPSGALRMKAFQPCKSCPKLLLQVVLAAELSQRCRASWELPADSTRVVPLTWHRNAARLIGKSSSEIQVLKSCSQCKTSSQEPSVILHGFSSLRVHCEHALPKPNPVVKNK